MKSIDAMLNRKYDTQNYHCVHFVIDAAKYLFDLDYSRSFLGFTGTLQNAVDHSKQKVIVNKLLEVPIDGCVVLMTNLMNQSHVGLFYCGSVLHLSEAGPKFQNLRTLKRHYTEFKFYEATCI